MEGVVKMKFAMYKLLFGKTMACKILLLQHILFLHQFNFMKITRLSNAKGVTSVID